MKQNISKQELSQKIKLYQQKKNGQNVPKQVKQKRMEVLLKSKL